MPEDDQKYLSIITTSPQEALIKASRVLPHIIAAKSRKIAEDIYPINYYEDDPLFINKWIEYITLLSYSKKCGDDQADLILNEKLEYAIHRMDNFDAVFYDLSFDKQVSLRNALWEQAAYLDAALREKIIKAYGEGLDKWLPRNENKKKYWQNYLLPYTQKSTVNLSDGVYG
ncbi:hypothetical protein IM40_08090 [Candidatus Paracaedimonas acanthamoebae]|nr:hypothetical protein IM40_08090 [Candidatus Paracaedimonas acanthamoebae]